MNEIEHSQEPILTWLNAIMVRLLDRCTTTVTISKNGTIVITVSNDNFLSSWTIWNWYTEDKVESMRREIEIELGIQV